MKTLIKIFILIFITSNVMAAEAITSSKENKEVESVKISKIEGEDVKKQSDNLVSEGAKNDIEINLISNLSEAKNEKERVVIFNNYLNRDEENNNEDPIINKRSEKVFEQFDLILSKLDEVDKNVKKNIDSLKEININLQPIDIKYLELKNSLSIARNEEILAWLKMQDIDFENKDNEIVLSELMEVKKHLLISKSKIREVSVSFKEIIFFLRGAITNIK